MRRRSLLVALALVSALTSVLLAVAVNVATGGRLPGGLSWLEPYAWPAVAVSALLTGLLAVWQQRDASPQPDPAVEPAPVTGALRPAELPAPPARFSGRTDELARIRAAVAAGEPVVAISGPAGVGKSALALHVAHALRSDYPDGQLFARLRGAGHDPVEPADLLARFLTALGADQDELRGDLDALSTRFRTRLSGQRTLLLLDDAASAGQVRPLLPGAGGCLVLVTSRPVLADLVSAHLVDLGVMTETEARELLAGRIGPGRVRADPEATAAVLRACGNLPLAVAIASSRLRARPDWTMKTMARRLADERGRLDQLQDGGGAVRASVATTYLELEPLHQRTFRRLGAHPGTDFDGDAAAALADLVGSGVWPVLDRLVDAQLVEVVNEQRYRLHDLLRLYAVERLDPSTDERKRAVSRLARQYAGRAAVAESQPSPYDTLIGPGEETLSPRTPPEADWLDAERENVIATVLRAVADGLNEDAWALAIAVEQRFAGYPHHADARRLWTAGLAAATALDDPAKLAQAEYSLARACQHSGDAREGLVHARRSLAGWERTGDRVRIAAAHRRLASGLENAGRLTEAEEHYQRTLEISRTLDAEGIDQPTVRRLTSNALRGLAAIHLAREEIDPAIRLLRKAVDLGQAAGSEIVIALARMSLARAHRMAGRLPVARELIEPQLAVFQRLGDALWLTAALRELGRVDLAERRNDAAMVRFKTALRLAESTGNRVGVGLTLRAMAEVEQARGRTEEAVRRYQEAADAFHLEDDDVREGITLLRLAVAVRREHPEEAAVARARAMPLLDGVDVPEIGPLLARLGSPDGPTPEPAARLD